MRKIVRALAFLMIFCVLYVVADDVLGTKAPDAIESMKEMYMLPKDTVDVLFVGSSHIGMNMDNRTMWERHGIAGYSLWGGMQPVWNSYYYLKEGLKSQTPKVAVAEIFLAGNTAEYSVEPVAFKNIHGMKFSIDKIAAAFASYPTWQKALEALWGMPYYHGRFSEVTEEDLMLFNSRYDTELKHLRRPSEQVTQLNFLDYGAITETLPLSEKNETYIRKMIDLCEAKNVKLLFLIAPFEATEEECKRLNTVERIARENGVGVLNYLKCYWDAGIDPKTDFYDIGHLGYEGIQKFSVSVADYLRAHYDLPDRRLDAGHIWNSGAVQTADMAPWYKMEEAFRGDGIGQCVDTGVALFDNRYSTWTLRTRLDMATAGDDGVYLSCYCEEAGKEHSGLLIRKTRDHQLSVLLGDGTPVALPDYDGEEATLSIVKQVDRYTVCWNGEIVARDTLLPGTPYSGNLLVGCQEKAAGGEKFRFSQTHVLNLEVYREAMSEEELIAWVPETLPEPAVPLGRGIEKPEVVYTLPEQFIGGQKGLPAYVDTGLRLYEAPGTRFTVLAEMIPGEGLGDGVYLADFSEEPDHYRGLLARLLSDGQLNLVFGNNYGITAAVDPQKPIRLAVVKDGSRYTVYLNGEKAADQVISEADAYPGTLLVGAQRDAEGRLFRQSPTRVTSLNVMAGCLSEDEILAWDYPQAAFPEKKKTAASSVNFEMADAFLGNGKDRYLDTGVRLYDTDKDWTLDTQITLRRGSNQGVFLACFAEQPEIGYRGLMVRQEDAESVTLYLGGLQTWKYPINGNTVPMHLVVSKQGSTYTVAVNGKVETTIESACAAYDGSLLVGCQADGNGAPFRFGNAMVDRLKVTDGSILPEEAAERSVMEEKHSRF